MCVAFFALQHPDYALILCSNRDEHLARPSQPASFHAFGGHPHDVLSGIDAQAGGTWLGITRTGRTGLLTNITEPPPTVPCAASRGQLVAAFLGAPPSHPLEAQVRALVPTDATYAGFNLVCFAPTSTRPLAFDAVLTTNHGAGGPVAHHTLSDAQRRLGALSNGIEGRGADDWPKVQHGLHALAHLLDALPADTSDDVLAERLLELLTWRSTEPPRERSELRHTIQVDPIDIEGKLYATRLSTVVLVSRTGRVLFVERDRWQLAPHPTLADPAAQRVFRFSLSSCE